jgi:hypothetical protein
MNENRVFAICLVSCLWSGRLVLMSEAGSCKRYCIVIVIVMAGLVRFGK